MNRNEIEKEIKIGKQTVVFKELGNPIRLKIVTIMAMEGHCNEAYLSKQLELKQADISAHLDSLKKAGIVDDIKKDNENFYGLCSGVEDDVCFLIKCFPRYGLNEKE